jgi:DNA-binding NarL/FixJ family response regulator
VTCPLRVVLVEDNEVYRSSLELLLGLQPGVEVVGQAGDCAGAVELARTAAPDVALVDFRLPGLDGAETAARLLAAAPGVAIVCLTAEASPEEREAILAAGARALIEKGEPIERLVRAMREACGQ